ncbi:hypothetical protein [Paraburkholderia sp. PGU16]|uniref:hypothetical protein n=1 Tax=Paraburkholderia TaxID=1822464 RepID=UPI0015DA36DF|nr:hypothetical protein [Paraburkholderia sp. PGU16]BEU23546.1 hypothetical protein PBP221_36860 [Paraburkholderia sp. 22B1P]
MKLRVGYEMVYTCSQSTPMQLMLNTHSSYVNEIIVPNRLIVEPVLHAVMWVGPAVVIHRQPEILI